jgi:hypothetical protein
MVTKSLTGPILIQGGYATQAEALDRARRCTPGKGMRIVVRKSGDAWSVRRERVPEFPDSTDNV